jgi:hypothetical protein
MSPRPAGWLYTFDGYGRARSRWGRPFAWHTPWEHVCVQTPPLGGGPNEMPAL